MSKLTAQQVVQILETPLGLVYHIDDPVVLAERKKISEKYRELTGTPRWFSPEELKTVPGGREYPNGAMLVPGFEECSIQARVWWLRQNVEVL